MPSPPIPATDGDSPAQPARHQTGLITILFTDLVGSTALKQQVGDRTGASLIQQHHALVWELLRGFTGGEERSTMGTRGARPSGGPSYTRPFHPKGRTQPTSRCAGEIRGRSAGRSWAFRLRGG